MPYYDPDKPFSITNWNTLIGDVNDILQGPPEGASNCPPVDPIDEVTDPHLWSVEDVTGMRDKLKETCPNISFSEELVLWKREIIDEIEDQMDDAWCDCETEPDEEDLTLCTHTQTAILAARYPEEQGIIEDAPCAICIGQHCREIDYGGTYYGTPAYNNDPKYDVVCDSWDEANVAMGNLLTFLNKLPGIGKKIEQYQGKVDGYVTTVDSLIARWKAECQGVVPEPSECGFIKFQICTAGSSAKYWQEKVDEQIEDFINWHDQGIPLLAVANAAAALNSEAVMGLYGRYPTDHNIFAECYSAAIPKWGWWDWWDPSTMDKLGDKWAFTSGLCWEGQDGVMPCMDVYLINSNNGWPANGKQIRIAPDGTWYIEGKTARNYNRSYSQTYFTRRIRWRCESLIGPVCEPVPGNCEFDEWGTNDTIWWSHGWPSEGTGGSCVGACVGFGCWLWSPLPEPNWASFGGDEYHLHYWRRSGMVDNSEKRDEWLADHYNWYNDHEAYDDRHAAYC